MKSVEHANALLEAIRAECSRRTALEFGNLQLAKWVIDNEPELAGRTFGDYAIHLHEQQAQIIEGMLEGCLPDYTDEISKFAEMFDIPRRGVLFLGLGRDQINVLLEAGVSFIVCG